MAWVGEQFVVEMFQLEIEVVQTREKVQLGGNVIFGRCSFLYSSSLGLLYTYICSFLLYLLVTGTSQTTNFCCLLDAWSLSLHIALSLH